MNKRIVTLFVSMAMALGCAAQLLPYQNPKLSAEERAADLCSRLTLKEKADIMRNGSPAIPRLGIPQFEWWSEALHGVARNGFATVFPNTTGMASSFDDALLQRIYTAVSDEARAKNNLARHAGEIKKYQGLSIWTPNINIFRDPRWGRGQETYGEDPYLTTRMGLAVVRGLQGPDDYKYRKLLACAKHFAVHSGPEGVRHSFDARPALYDLWDTYLPAFRDLVCKAGVHGVMCAYNRVDGQPCCGNDPLLVDILRNQWQFQGYVTSDCWAVSDFASYHKTHPNNIVAASDAMLAGTDLECGDLYQLLAQGVEKGLHSERDINTSLARLFTIQMKLGMYDPQEMVPYSRIGREVIECEAHRRHALLMARESMVLLKNERNMLPLNAKKIKRIALIGPNADNQSTQLANYFGVPSRNITPLQCLKDRYGDHIRIDYYAGTDIAGSLKEGPSVQEIVAAAKKADVIIFVGGISADYEGEAGDAGAAGFSGFASGDRTNISLPQVQLDLLKALKATRRPLVLVNMSGSVMDFAWESSNVEAILQAWYGGQSAGEAIVDVLFGDYNPQGKLPVTFYRASSQLPDFEDYSMKGRTYRYFSDPLFAFGYGLSYTSFNIEKMIVEKNEQANPKSLFTLRTTVKNTGKREGTEVLQVYVRRCDDTEGPLKTLKAFERVPLKAGESKAIAINLGEEAFTLFDPAYNSVHMAAGKYDIFFGASSRAEDLQHATVEIK